MDSIPCSKCGCPFIPKERPARYIRKRTTQRLYCPNCTCYRLTQSDIDEIVLAYQQGESMEVLGKRYNCDQGTIRYHLKRRGIERRKCYDWFVERVRQCGSSNKGKIASQETRKKIAAASRRAMNTPEAREKVSQQTKRMLVEGKYSYVSKLEDKVADALTQRGITYTRQYGITQKGKKGYIAVVDFLLSDGRAIEVQGSYWHADPREYPDGPVYAAQKEKVRRDEQKHQLLMQLGIPLILLWEIDIERDLSALLDRLL